MQAIQLLKVLLDKISSKQNIIDQIVICSTLDIISSLKPLCENAVKQQEKKFFAEHGEGSDTPSFRQFQAEYMCVFPAENLDASRELLASIIDIEICLISPLIQSCHARSFLLTGPAGAGKTHSIVSFAKRRLDKGAHTLVLFGEDFDNAEPWDVVRSKLGFGADVGRDKLLSCLQASAQANNYCFVIAIDALNEGAKARKWKNKLPEIIQQLNEYPRIKIVVSSRDIYTNLVVDERFPGYAYSHIGFTRNFHDVLSSFSQRYNVESEITPIFTDELRNPLLLHLVFKTHKSEDSCSLDVSTSGFSTIFSKHLKQIDDSLRERLDYVSPKNIVRAVMSKLSDVLAHSETQTINWEYAVNTIKPILGNELNPERFIDELVKEQLLILSSTGDEDFLIRFGYQRFGDMLRASSIVQSYQETGNSDLSILAEKLAILTDIERGVLEALASILPEEIDIEITDNRLGLDKDLAHSLFVKSLTWRSKQSVTPAIEEHMFGALRTGGLWQAVFESLFQLSIVPSHYLNAESWFKDFQWRQDSPSRDTYLSVALSESYNKKGAIYFLIEALEKIDETNWPKESYKLASSALLWCCSATDRRVRDQATRCLGLLFKKYPVICLHAVNTFAGCDDDYILESLIQAMYTSCLLSPESAEKFVQPLNKYIRLNGGSNNILIREHSQLLRQELVNLGVEEYRISNQYVTPSMPLTWPVISDVQTLLALEKLPSNMRLWGDQLGPDFWRYIVEPRLRAFDLQSQNITHENIACWIMREAEYIGYPGYSNGSLKHDLATLYKYGRGRAKPGYAETIGKKCYWVAFHRLIGVLAANLATAQSRWEPQLSSDRFWSLELRKVDISDIRDLSPKKKYPLGSLIIQELELPENNVNYWLKTDDYFVANKVLILSDESSTAWINLSFYSEAHAKKDEDDVSFDAESFLCISSYRGYFVDPNNTEAFELDNYSNDHCYRVYVAEYPRSPAFKQCVAEQDTTISDDQLIFSSIRLLRGGEWEYDYSSNVEQSSINMPCPDLIEKMNLRWDQGSGWLDENQDLAAFSHNIDRNFSLFIRKDILDSYLSKFGKSLVFSRFGRKQFSRGFGDDARLMEVTSRYIYMPSDCSLKRISEEVEYLGFEFSE
ncbi:ATP-binding protein [Acinetobacter sp. YH12218]|uniref:ATP-binding protein n=1 Tax=Acinetobacter sp. YH12218 TaxID=2601152 RepID=UPI0015D3587E|nr:ATP-binding protein [Acinetobacter sp. YH12218]